MIKVLTEGPDFEDSHHTVCVSMQLSWAEDHSLAELSRCWLIDYKVSTPCGIFSQYALKKR